MAPDVDIDPTAVHQVADRYLSLAETVRVTTAAAQADTARPDAPTGFAATTVAGRLWGEWSRQLDDTATETAVLGHTLHEAAASWTQIDADVAALLGGG